MCFTVACQLSLVLQPFSLSSDLAHPLNLISLFE